MGMLAASGMGSIGNLPTASGSASEGAPTRLSGRFRNHSHNLPTRNPTKNDAISSANPIAGASPT